METVKRIVVSLLLAAFGVLFLNSCTFHNYFDNWESESELVPYVKYNTVYCNEQEVNIQELLESPKTQSLVLSTNFYLIDNVTK